MIDVPALPHVSGRLRSKVVDYIALTKPELTGLSALTALCAFYLGSTSFDLPAFFATGIGTLLLGGGAGTLNQYMERQYDALMKRTERRPLPAGRVRASAALWYGIVLSLIGLVFLFSLTTFLTGTLGFITILSYLFWYTPLKRISPLSTLVGAIPGALPPLIGWSAATHELSLGGWILFAILFFWQMPHFLSLSWMYRKDYARAGYRMLSVLDPVGSRVSKHILVHCTLLLLASLTTTLFGMTGSMYTLGAIVLGLSFLLFGVLFHRSTSSEALSGAGTINRYSRYLFFASLLYLPALMFLMSVDKL